MVQRTQPQVLIIDSSEDSREVIQIGLDRRGVSSRVAATTVEGLESVKSLNPSVIVLDVDTLEADFGSDSEGDHRDFVLTARANQCPLLLIGEAPYGKSNMDSGERIAKPYHFSALLNKIEGMLERPQELKADVSDGALQGSSSSSASGGIRRAA